MAKKNLGKDLDLFPTLGDGAATPPAKEETTTPAPDTDMGDIFGLGGEDTSKAEPEKEAAKEDKTDKPADEPAAKTDPAPVDDTNILDEPDPSKEGAKDPSSPTDTKDEEDEMEKLIREAGLWIEELKQSPDLSEKDKKKLQEISEQNDELATANETLTRQLEVAREQNNRSVENSEEMRIYKPLIDKLEKEPQLMLFAKYYWSKNDAMKGRLTDICKDMLQTLTGIDVYALLDKETTDSATAFGSDGADSAPPALTDAPAKADVVTRRKKDNTFSL